MEKVLGIDPFTEETIGYSEPIEPAKQAILVMTCSINGRTVGASTLVDITQEHDIAWWEVWGIVVVKQKFPIELGATNHEATVTEYRP